MNNIWKLIDTNEIILELCWSYLGLSWNLKNYNKIKAKDLEFKYLSSNDSSLILQCDDRNAIFHEQSDYYCMQQMLTQNIIFLEKKLVVSNILSFASRKMLVKLSFCNRTNCSL